MYTYIHIYIYTNNKTHISLLMGPGQALGPVPPQGPRPAGKPGNGLGPAPCKDIWFLLRVYLCIYIYIYIYMYAYYELVVFLYVGMNTFRMFGFFKMSKCRKLRVSSLLCMFYVFVYQ